MQSLSLSAAAAETIGNNEDLLKQLLLWIPAKPLIRFKCVSKLWLSLISDPQFCHSHTLLNPNPKFPSAFFFSPTAATHPHFISLLPNPNPPTPLSFIPDPKNLKILQSCNGLLLCTDGLSVPTKFYVVNPTTSRFSEIALPKTPCTLLSLALAFDPSKSPHFKLVSVSGSRAVHSTLRNIGIEIYSSRTRTWRTCESTVMWFPSSQKFLPCVYCNGRINWLSTFCWLVHYDIDEGHYGVVDGIIGHPFSDCEYSCFGESGGRLHLIEVDGSDLNQLGVLEMGKDYSGWFLKYQVDLSRVRPAFPSSTRPMCCPFLFLDVEENEEQDPVLLLHIGHKVVSFNTRDKRFKTHCNLNTPSLVGWRDAYPYMETLACV
ncbi:PREDICTED: F-box protein At5g07610-like [Fragaria vesca subsp. vesca]|uniref:F-box protein At5g07610-like n=1 Tax=Fragaria vesca subsp. vesca TaxID=101020 RepID=UPI0002C343E2|nr:PREDICTED: F-box protein At5g07610-like [Fragaria vesca subsp. vesca]